MNKNKSIYLLVECTGWERFSLNDKSALERRNISIHEDAVIKNDVRIGNDVTICSFAYIEESVELSMGCYISEGCDVRKNSKLGRRVTIGRNSIIREYVNIGDDVKIGASVQIYSYARIGSDSEIRSHSSIKYGCIIPSNSIVEEGEKSKCLYIIGSWHYVIYNGKDSITIGCISQSISDWKKNYSAVGIENKYSIEQIEEYGRYIEIISELHSSNNNKLENNI